MKRNTAHRDIHIFIFWVILSLSWIYIYPTGFYYIRLFEFLFKVHLRAWACSACSVASFTWLLFFPHVNFFISELLLHDRILRVYAQYSLAISFFLQRNETNMTKHEMYVKNLFFFSFKNKRAYLVFSSLSLYVSTIYTQAAFFCVYICCLNVQSEQRCEYIFFLPCICSTIIFFRQT